MLSREILSKFMVSSRKSAKFQGNGISSIWMGEFLCNWQAEEVFAAGQLDTLNENKRRGLNECRILIFSH